MTAEPPVWFWQLTPREVVSGYYLYPGEENRLQPETEPFDVPRVPLGLQRSQLDLHYQLALSSCSTCPDIQAIRELHPEVPEPGPEDKRSGVLVLSGERIVGSFLTSGVFHVQGIKIVVAPEPEFRGQGIAFEMMRLWYGATRRPRKVLHQPITPAAVRIALSVHDAMVASAVSRGLPVPERVLRAVKAGEADEVRQRVAGLDQDVRPDVPSRAQTGDPHETPLT